MANQKSVCFFNRGAFLRPGALFLIRLEQFFVQHGCGSALELSQATVTEVKINIAVLSFPKILILPKFGSPNKNNASHFKHNKTRQFCKTLGDVKPLVAFALLVLLNLVSLILRHLADLNLSCFILQTPLIYMIVCLRQGSQALIFDPWGSVD